MVFHFVVLAGLTSTLRDLFPEIGPVLEMEEDSLLMTEGKWLEAIGGIVTFCLSKSKPKTDWLPSPSKSKFKTDWLLCAGATAKPLIELQAMKRSGINNRR